MRIRGGLEESLGRQSGGLAERERGGEGVAKRRSRRDMIDRKSIPLLVAEIENSR